SNPLNLGPWRNMQTSYALRDQGICAGNPQNGEDAHVFLAMRCLFAVKLGCRGPGSRVSPLSVPWLLYACQDNFLIRRASEVDDAVRSPVHCCGYSHPGGTDTCPCPAGAAATTATTAGPAITAAGPAARRQCSFHARRLVDRLRQ